jgi:hypothetical protein
MFGGLPICSSRPDIGAYPRRNLVSVDARQADVAKPDIRLQRHRFGEPILAVAGDLHHVEIDRERFSEPCSDMGISTRGAVPRV